MIDETKKYENLVRVMYKDIEKYIDETLYYESDLDKPSDLDFLSSRFNNIASLVKVLTKIETGKNFNLSKAQGFLNILHEYLKVIKEKQTTALMPRLD